MLNVEKNELVLLSSLIGSFGDYGMSCAKFASGLHRCGIVVPEKSGRLLLKFRI